MATINFNIKIKDTIVNYHIKLEGQQLYFFNQDTEHGKKDWIISHLKNEIKISDIEIEE
ncbi:hypothetical protein [uncultured Clostridium sp.]|uniref:hypothetical protein n=1 Tax=uncultured Clostridium sp. TaxID=59620 RepID=UPI00258B3EB1|nr:hypothetical protein [uncultured Clostridium sp.]MDU1348287.1 hypothetical protein [Clostridium argentinense]